MRDVERMSDQDITRRTVLKTGAGLAAATAGAATFAGAAAAHFPRDLDIDVEPGSEENRVNPRSEGVTRVAVLRNDAFDPTGEDVRYRFGAPDVVAAGDGATPVRHRVADVDDDGWDDLVLQFRTDEAGFDGDEEEVELRWDRTEDREHGLSGRDDVTLVGR